MKEVTLLTLIFLGCINTYADTCPRDHERLSRVQQFELKTMDRLVGTYQLTGNSFCQNLKIETSEVCDPTESDHSLATAYQLTVSGNEDHPTTSYLHYSVQPGSRSEREFLSIGRRKISLQNRHGSGGGITTSYYKATLNFDRHQQLKSLDIVETSGVFFQSVNFQTHCEIK